MLSCQTRRGGGANSLMSSSTPHAASGASAAVMGTTDQQNHLPQLRPLQERAHQEQPGMVILICFNITNHIEA